MSKLLGLTDADLLEMLKDYKEEEENLRRQRRVITLRISKIKYETHRIKARLNRNKYYTPKGAWTNNPTRLKYGKPKSQFTEEENREYNREYGRKRRLKAKQNALQNQTLNV